MPINKTPRGKSMWAKVVEPDTKFNPLGDYSIDLILKEGDEDTQELCADLERMVEEERTKVAEENPAKFKKMPEEKPLSALPFREVEDEEGNETGELRFKFKMKAAFNSKNGGTHSQRPLVVDSKGKPILNIDENNVVVNKDFKVGNGSEVVVHYEPYPYYMSSTKTCGVSLRLKAVQVMKLQEYSTYDFDEEEGFEYEQKPKAAEVSAGQEDYDF